MNHKGTGLGLFICKKLIIKMGGSVEVESKLGYGSRFIVTLQLKAKDKKL
jgi:signal transduction histidine kinase